MMSNTFKVGEFTCEMTILAFGHISVEWSPQMPTQLTRKERAQYRAGRNALITKFAKASEINFLIVEI